MTSFLTFVFALSFLIIAHELGHFLAAKRKKVKVEEFGLGYPPRIWGKKIGETIYSINWLPLGGFVKILGEIEEGKELSAKLAKRSLNKQTLLTRTEVSLGGVTMNLLLAILIFAVVYSFLGVPRKTGQVKIASVSFDSPAETAGLVGNDIVLGYYQNNNFVSVKEADQLINVSNQKKGSTLTLVIGRMQKQEGTNEIACPQPEFAFCYQVPVVPRVNPPANEGPLGIAITDSESYKPALWLRPFWGVKEGFSEAFFWGKTILIEVGGMFAGLFRGQTPKNLAGPVGIYQATSTIQKEAGNWAVLHFFGVLSVNLAVVNLLPIPALDGSRLLFLAWEFFFRRKPNPKFETLFYQIGMAIMIGLLLLITVGDIQRLRVGLTTQ